MRSRAKQKCWFLPGRGFALSALITLAFGVALAAEENPGGRQVYPFAMCSNGNLLTNPEYPVKMLDAGARVVRLDLCFPSVRRQPGDNPDQWNWEPLEKARQMCKQNPDLRVLDILGYGTEWAEDERFKQAPGGVPSHPQRGISVLPVTDPKNLYGHFVYETVKRYKDVIHLWESWNEPDLPGAYFFKGTGRDFFPYQKACYLAAKQADPECEVLFAGLCYASVEGYLAAHNLKAPTPYPPKECFFEEYLKECVKDPDAKKNHYYFDAMNQHSYSRASDVYDYAAIDARLMQDYLGEVKPIWITEMGIVDKGGPFGCTPQEYCDYQLQAFAWGKLAGVECFFHFQLDNSNGHGLYTGMLGEPKPVLATYRDVLLREFAGARFVRQLHGTKGVDFLAGHSAFDPAWKAGYDLFEFQRLDGKARILMAFADTEKAVDVKIPAVKARATLITRDNQRREITARDGNYEVTLPGATNVGGWPAFGDNKDAVALGQPEHLIGGATIVIVEE